MRRYFFLLLLCSQFVFGQDKFVLYGTVTDEQGATLPYVTVKAFGADTTLVAITDMNGDYQISIPKTDSLCVSFSFLGFKTEIDCFSVQGSQIVRNAVLIEDATVLQEAIIKGSIVVQEPDKTLYYPTQIQRNGTNSGTGLLYDMMIPELNVDKRSGSATTRDNRTVTQCINGVPASLTEIKNLRPKDIVRIDFHPIPTGKFAHYDAVIDYVVKTRDLGGYVDIKTETTVPNMAGSYDGVVKYKIRKWSYSLLNGVNFLNDRKSGSDKEEWIGLSPSFCKTSSVEKYKKEELGGYAQLGGNYDTESLSFVLRTGFVGLKTPHENFQNTISYQPTIYPTSLSQVFQTSKNISAYYSGYLQWNFHKNQYFFFDTSYKYGHNNYNRSFTENSYNSFLTTKEDVHQYSLGAIYSLNTEKSGSLTLKLYEIRNVYDDLYRGSSENNQKLIKNNISTTALYRHYFSQKLFAQLDLTLQHTYSKVNDVRESKWLFLPNLYVSYQTSEKGKLILRNISGYINPPIEWKSALSQEVNTYEILRGNEHLGHFSAYMPSLMYSHNWKNLNMNFCLDAGFSSHSIQDVFYEENGKLIHSYAMGSAYSYGIFGYKITSYWLNRKLQMSAEAKYGMMKANNEFRDKRNFLAYGLNVLYNLGDFVFSGTYQSKSKSINVFTGSDYGDIPAVYSFSASYSKGNWYASVELNNVFGGQHYQTQYVNSSVYKKTSLAYSPIFYPSATFSISYNFDFGRKKIEREEETVNKTIESGILRPKE